MQKVLSSMYHHWEDNSSSSQLTYEYFLLRGSGDPMVFWDKVTALMSALMTASYKRIQVLNEDQIGTLVEDLYGLTEFSVTEAMNQAVQKSERSSLRLLWLGDAQNRRKQVNTSLSEARLKQEEQYRKQQAQARVSAEQAKTQPKKTKKKGKEKAKQTQAEVLDLFGTEK